MIEINMYPNKIMDTDGNLGVIVNFLANNTCEIMYDNLSLSNKILKFSEITPVITEKVTLDFLLEAL